MTTAKSTLKKVLAIRQAPPMHWVGDGFPVHSMFSYDGSGERMSPFLLLDYARPTKFQPSPEPRGVGEHPHRGFETVTIVFQGDLQHRDSAGHGGSLSAGDVQWMTAASGVVHEERFGREMTEKGGTMEMVQLWVNLPARQKMSSPRYQDIRAASIPTVRLDADAGSVRVIAGEFRGTHGPAKTFTPIELWDVRLSAGREVEFVVPDGHTTAFLVLRGEVWVNDAAGVGEVELAVLDREGDRFAVRAAQDARLVVLAGDPIEEPVVGYGPFVMNTEEEIRKAISDFRNGRMGSLPA
jgi:quercetin 2,3-dioxygenase